jgi:hypothetical protein
MCQSFVLGFGFMGVEKVEGKDRLKRLHWRLGAGLTREDLRRAVKRA